MSGKKRRWNLKRIVVSTLVILLCVALLATSFVGLFAGAEGVPEKTGRALEAAPVVRVLLSRLGVTDRVDLLLQAPYAFGNAGESSMVFQPDCELTLMLNGEYIYAYYGGMSWNAGESVCLTRYGTSGGLTINGGANQYRGDLSLRVSGGKLQMVLSIGLEDYVAGVVPYEMGDGFPLEALKAQAVAARSYAMCNLSPNDAYDVVDTTNDQVFKGFDASAVQSARATEETKGLCGYYQGKPAICYYSASNGGQTDLVSHMWKDSGDMGYYQMTADPYDVENPLSLERIYRVPRLGDALKPELAALLMKSLCERTGMPADQLRLDEVVNVASVTPMFTDSPTLVMTELSFTLRYSLRRTAQTLEPEENLFTTVTDSPDITAAPSPGLADFAPAAEEAVLTLPIFPLLEAEMGLSLNSYDNEIITVTEDETQFTVVSRRYGHGLGMSQRGAEWMAAMYEKTYLDILAFYYPGMELVTLTWPETSASFDPQRLSTPGPRPTATPRPTLMPQTADISEGLYVATVDHIDDDSSLNLRTEPTQAAEVRMRLYKHQPLLVVSLTDDGVWAYVRTDAVDGYVMVKFLTKVE